MRISGNRFSMAALSQTLMKNTHYRQNPATRLAATLAGALALGIAPAMADDDTAKFNAADADDSGSLSLAEFRSTLSKNARQKQVLKKFAKADANDDKLVTLEEWLAYKADETEDETEEQTARFNALDTDDDGLLSYEEFSATRKGKEPLIETRKRFLKADTDDDGAVSLEEWLTYKNDGLPDDGKPYRKFKLADLDGNDELTLDEFATTFPKKTPKKTILRKFNKEDDNEDGVLTRDEWNPGGGKKPA